MVSQIHSARSELLWAADSHHDLRNIDRDPADPCMCVVALILVDKNLAKPSKIQGLHPAPRPQQTNMRFLMRKHPHRHHTRPLIDG